MSDSCMCDDCVTWRKRNMAAELARERGHPRTGASPSEGLSEPKVSEELREALAEVAMMTRMLTDPPAGASDREGT